MHPQLYNHITGVFFRGKGRSYANFIKEENARIQTTPYKFLDLDPVKTLGGEDMRFEGNVKQQASKYDAISSK